MYTSIKLASNSDSDSGTIFAEKIAKTDPSESLENSRIDRIKHAYHEIKLS